MSQFEDDGLRLADDYFVQSLHEVRRKRIEKMRSVGYAEYDKPANRLSRLYRFITFKKVMTRNEWNKIVDKALEVKDK